MVDFTKAITYSLHKLFVILWRFLILKRWNSPNKTENQHIHIWAIRWLEGQVDVKPIILCFFVSMFVRGNSMSPGVILLYEDGICCVLWQFFTPNSWHNLLNGEFPDNAIIHWFYRHREHRSCRLDLPNRSILSILSCIYSNFAKHRAKGCVSELSAKTIRKAIEWREFASFRRKNQMRILYSRSSTKWNCRLFNLRVLLSCSRFSPKFWRRFIRIRRCPRNASKQEICFKKCYPLILL